MEARSPGESPPTEIGETALLVVTLSEADIRAGALQAHDRNPLHHDLAQARAAGYPGLIASGAHTGAIFMGMTATHFSKPAPDGRARTILGLGFDLRFRAVIHADEPITMRWVVTGWQWKPSLRGWIVESEGEARTPRGIALGGTARSLLRTPPETTLDAPQ